ncbi:MAG: DUF2339 domain-containing protein [Pyrinomonadaceae bacterium]
MSEIDEKIEQLQLRLDKIVTYQGYFDKEISQIRYEINVLRAVQQKRNAQPQAETKNKPPVREYIPPTRKAETSAANEEKPPAQPNYQPNYNQQKQSANYKTSASNETYHSKFPQKAPQAEPLKANLEKFIGENLLSKIGIVILVVGVAIGAKYAIDRNLISPLTRIILGYAFGFGLLGFALKLKPKYHNFSAVLLSGAMAIMYFITYFAYSLYGLFPQTSAFALMLIFTAFTVAAAINYNRQVIAHIGLVGAYAVPFLLSDNSGNYAFLFAYIAIINGGILAISLKKYWKPLFYTSFIFTWTTFYGFYLIKYQTAGHFNLALIFLTIFFLIFYLTFIAYKLISRENVAIENIVLILANSFIFYGFGYSILDRNEGFANYLGLFTAVNAAIHFVFAFAVSRLKLIPQDLIYLLSALVLTFATIAVPVQLDGNFVTLVWTVEAAILFWIGRAKQIRLYEYYSFPLMFLATVSLIADWMAFNDFRVFNDIRQSGYSFFNGTFITSCVFVCAFTFIHFLNRDEKYEPALDAEIHKPLSYLIPTIALCALYNTFRMQIHNYFHFQMTVTDVIDFHSPLLENQLRAGKDIGFFNALWQINYTMFFLTVLSFVNIKRWKNTALAYATIILNIFSLMIFLAIGLYFLGVLRETYLLQSIGETSNRGIMHILIRYISYVFVAGSIFSLFKYTKEEFLREVLPEDSLKQTFEFVLYVSLWLILSSELINLMDILGYKDSYKLGLSILWGIYALVLIILGIYQNNKHLRVGAIALFGFTLAKLFFYDIAELDTISKTIVFVSLGILLLIVSFLYNKYKHLIFETNEPEIVSEN